MQLRKGAKSFAPRNTDKIFRSPLWLTNRPINAILLQQSIVPRGTLPGFTSAWLV